MAWVPEIPLSVSESMASSLDGKGGEDIRRLTEAFQHLLSNDSSSQSSSHLRSGECSEPDDLQRLLSVARKDTGTDVELLQRLSSRCCNRSAMDRKRIESRQEAILVLDEDRFVCCASAGARRLLSLSPETKGQIFNYYFKPDKPLLITIERADRTVGLGRLLAINACWEGKAAYLVTVQDVTCRERNRVASQRRSRV